MAFVVSTDKLTVAELIRQARLRHIDIVRKAGLSAPTVTRIMRGEPVLRYSLEKALDVINASLGTSYTVESIDAPYTE